MTTHEYQKWIRQEWGDLLLNPTLEARFVSAVGLGGEAGEVQELLKKQFRDGKLIKPDLLLELGDVLHYLTVIARMHGITLEEIMQANIDKLEERKTKRDLMEWSKREESAA